MMELLFGQYLRFWDSCVHPSGWPCRPKASSLDRGSEDQDSRRSNANSARKDSNMKFKDKTTDALGLRANTVPSHTRLF